VSFQAILGINTGTAPGDIVFNYLDLRSGDTWAEGNNATVGIKANGTQSATQLSNRLLVSFPGTSAFVGTGEAFRIAPASTLRLTSATADGVTLTWTSNSSAPAGFEIERSTDGTTFSQIFVAAADARTFTDTDVQPGGTYFYRVRAFDAYGEAPYSNVDSVRFTAVIDHHAGFADHADLTANGNTTFPGTVAQLTAGPSGTFLQAGSLFSTSRVDVRSFVTSFTFQITAGTTPVGNGITFTIQGSGPTALGPNGGGLGYGPDLPSTTARGIRNSVAIKFKTVVNVVGQETDNATGLFSDGRSPSVPEAGSGDVNVPLDPAVIDLHSQHPFRVDLTYDGTTLTETITDTVTGLSFTTSYVVDIPALVGSNVAYVGFTGATGSLHTGFQVIEDWTFQSTALAAGGAGNASPQATHAGAGPAGGTGLAAGATGLDSLAYAAAPEAASAARGGPRQGDAVTPPTPAGGVNGAPQGPITPAPVVATGYAGLVRASRDEQALDAAPSDRVWFTDLSGLA
jgi:hypothetical protein